MLNKIFAAISTQIAVIAPSSGMALELLRHLPELPNVKYLFNKNCDYTQTLGFHSDYDDNRLEFLKQALQEDNIKIIWSLRGGYGAAKLIKDLQKMSKPTHPKIFIGFSDLTALHLFFSQNWGWNTIHGASVLQGIGDRYREENFTALIELLNNRANKLYLSDLKPLNALAEEIINISGPITGGNLTLIECSIGTNWQVQTKNKILFLEDVNCKPYQIDRSLLHLQQAGVLEEVKAIIFGTFDNLEQELKNNQNHQYLDRQNFSRQCLKMLQNFANSIGIPIFRSEQFGHSHVNYPIIYNSVGIIRQNHDSQDKILEMTNFTINI